MIYMPTLDDKGAAVSALPRDGQHSSARKERRLRAAISSFNGELRR